MRTLFAIALLAASVPAGVLKVASTGGTHTSLQAALDAALDGDIVIIDLDYSAGSSPAQFASISGKGLTLVGEGPNRRRMPPTVISGVPLHSELVLRNLEFVSSGIEPLLGALLALNDNPGGVLVEDCLLLGREEPFLSAVGGQALLVFQSQRVSVARCQLEGGDGTSTLNMPPFVVWQPSSGGRAVSVVDSRVVFHDSLLVGGDAGHDGLFGEPGVAGSPALSMTDSQVWLTGCDVSGGDGGFGAPHGAAAPGVLMDGAASLLRRLDSDLIGGAGAESEPDAPGLEQLAGQTALIPGSAIALTLGAPVRPGDSSAIVVDGPADTLFGLFTSFGAGFLPKASLHGVVLGDLTTFAGPLFITSLPPSGHYELPFTVPAVGFDGFLKVDQVISSQPGAGLILSNASAYVQVENGL